MKYWFLILLSALLVFRCFYLDQDAPPLQLSNILQEDEPYYCNGAMNMYCASEGRSVPGFEKTKNEWFDIDTRLPVFLSLKVFGNNYWGLRMPFLIASLLVIWLMYSIFKSIRPLLNFDLLLLLIMATNFYLFLFSRFVNPQIFSILGITFAIWFLVKYGLEKPLHVILLGVFVAAAPVFIYTLNFYFLAGFGIYIAIKAITEKRYNLIFYFAAGVIACSLFFVICLYAIGNSPQIMLSTLSNGDNDMAPNYSSIKGLLYNSYKDIATFVSTGFFRYQLLLLFAFMACLPFLFKGVLKLKGKEKELGLLIPLLFIFHLMQNFFVLNHSTKKLIIDIPIVLIGIFVAYPKVSFTSMLGTSQKKVMYLIWLLVILGLCYLNIRINKSEAFWLHATDAEGGCYNTTPQWFDIANYVSVGLLFIAVVMMLFSDLKFPRILLVSAFSVSITFNLLFTYKVCFADRKYEIRDMLISLRPVLHNKVIGMGYSFTYELYTGCKPALHLYPTNYKMNGPGALDSLLKKQKIDYVIERNSVESPKNIDSNLIPLKKFPIRCYYLTLFKNKLE